MLQLVDGLPSQAIGEGGFIQGLQSSNCFGFFWSIRCAGERFS